MNHYLLKLQALEREKELLGVTFKTFETGFEGFEGARGSSRDKGQSSVAATDASPSSPSFGNECRGKLSSTAGSVEIPDEWSDGVRGLDAGSAPADVPERRWVLFVEDSLKFLTAWGGAAAALGWDALDVFGCDQKNPFARVDRLGLVWLLGGRRLLALTAASAAIEAVSGAVLSYYRNSCGNTGRVPAWGLRSSGDQLAAPQHPAQEQDEISRLDWDELVEGFKAGTLNWLVRREQPGCKAPPEALREYGY
jgi:hypothetical protein